ncbi:uncharacterized protein LOC135162374 [Diachasmimorpha longicaudata]|uniref:uncharacterized protein LOC135162374 n=1 Tax=Diachasmimorpha longicaudata TaxID=58733 RepID=UPI0030B88D6C
MDIPSTSGGQSGVRVATPSSDADASPALSTISEDCAAIHMLDDDCLFRIFCLFSIGEKLIIEQVCRRWKRVSKLAWYRMRRLNLARAALGTTDFDKLPLQFQNIQGIARLLRRCGQYLSILKLGSPCHCTMISFIARHCKKLVQLEISAYHNGRNIHNTPKANGLEFFCQKKLSNVLPSDELGVLAWPKLYELHLRGPSQESDAANRNRVYLPHCYHYYIRDLKKVAMMSLENFDLRESLDSILRLKGELTYLSLANSIIGDDVFFPHLVFLEHVNVERVLEVDAEFLTMLSTSCTKLKYLNLNYCSNLDDEGMMHLWLLNELEELTVNFVPGITDFAFSGCHSLKKLSCQGCQCVRDGELIFYLNTLPPLEYLNLQLTAVTPEILAAANTMTKVRSSNIQLYLLVNASIIRHPHGFYDSSLLVIDGTNDSVDPLRIRTKHYNPYPSYYEFEYEHGIDSEPDDWRRFFADDYESTPPSGTPESED